MWISLFPYSPYFLQIDSSKGLMTEIHYFITKPEVMLHIL